MQGLTNIEWEVASEYCFGLTDKEVADRLHKPLTTLRTHKKKIFRKLGVNTTHEMVIYCITAYLNINWNARIIHEIGLTIFNNIKQINSNE